MRGEFKLYITINNIINILKLNPFNFFENAQLFNYATNNWEIKPYNLHPLCDNK